MAANASIHQPRILIVSGSNGLFGLSAAAIAQETGLTTINLSSHGGLGGEYILRRAEQQWRTGDIVLLPLEYQFYTSAGISDDLERGDMLARFLISYDRDALRQVSALSLLNFFWSNTFSFKSKGEYVNYLRGRLTPADIMLRLQQQKDQGECYSSLTLNDFGDETCNLQPRPEPVPPAVLQTAMPKSMHETELDPGGYIQRFLQSATRQGVKIIPLYPVSTYTPDYQQPAFHKSAQKIGEFWQGQGMVMEDSMWDALLPPKLMYNTNYHPQEQGRQQRTKSVLRLVKKHLKQLEKQS